MNYDHYNYYDDDGDEQESEMLIEEIDPNYEPTNQEIKMYAISTLGMNLPEDKDFLYLAREALKAPLPDKWNAFQNRQGDVYYKHRITQQITSQHPIDIQYRRRYQQEKEKVARRNLKSMVSKPNNNASSNLSGISKLKLLSNIAREEQITGNIKEIDNVSGLDFSDINQKYDREFQKIKKEFEQTYEEFKISNEKLFKQKQKQLQMQHEAELRRIKHNYSAGMSLDDRINQQTSKLKKDLEEQFKEQYESSLRETQQTFKRNAIAYQKDLQNNLKNKLKQIESKGSQKIQMKESAIENLQNLIERQRRENEQQMETEIKNAQREFQSRKVDYEIDIESKIKLETENLIRMRQQNVKKRELELHAQFLKIKKLLKNSPEDQILEFIEKKSKLKELSQKKFEMQKLREIQTIQKQINELYEKSKISKQELLEKRYKSLTEKKLEEAEKEYHQSLQILNSKMQARIEQKQKEIYDKFKQKLSTYQINKNKGFINIREKFISELEEKKIIMDSESNLSSAKLVINQKEFHISSQEKQILVLKREIALLERTLLKYQLDRKLFKSTPEEINAILKGRIEQQQKDLPKQLDQSPIQSYIPQVENLPSIFRQYEQKVIVMRNRLNNDKAILKKVMAFLQDNASVPFYQRRRILNSNLPAQSQEKKLYSIGASHADLIKKYNKDIRICRENQKTIFKLQNLLDKARSDEMQALDELKNSIFQFETPQLSEYLQSSNTEMMKEICVTTKLASDNPIYSSGHNLNSTKKVQDMFKEHSRFLVNVKNELNSRLAQIRGMGYISRVF